MSNLYVLMGPQGAGKGTQAKLLADRFGLPIVATGDILRVMATQETPLGQHVKEVLDSGELVSDDILAEVIKTRLCMKDCLGGCILDGFPRTLPQARLLEKIAQEDGNRIVVIKIDVPRELLLRRLTGRRICNRCNSIYHMEFKPPRHDEVCDLDGEPLVTRPDDDTIEAIQQRLQLYQEKTRPLLEYYEASNRLYRVDGTGTPEAVFGRLAEIVAKESNAERGNAAQ
ncbi:MAG TPA: adenylate kinase [Blastocatellia bacterium]|nr:adenylate kinase [Blastocatellia bacterium]